MKNLKICVCFYGFLRSFAQTQRSLKEHLILPYNADVFVCTPNTFFGRASQDPWNNRENPATVTNEYLQHAFYGNLKGASIFDHNVNIYKQEVIKNKIIEQNFMSAYSWRSFSMFDLIRKVLQMRQNHETDNGFKYDAVILSRPDIQIAKKVELENLDLNTLHHSISHAAPVYGTELMFGDHLLFSKRENIDSFISLYDRVSEYYNQGITMNNETLMGYHLLKNNVEWKRSDFVLHGVIR